MPSRRSRSSPSACGPGARPEALRVRAVFAVAASYASLFVLLLWQALRGQSFVAPDSTALTALAIWALTTTIVLAAIGTKGTKDTKGTKAK